VGALAILIYDGVLILEEEVRVVWGTKLSLARAAYVLNKYSAILTVALMNNAILALIPLSTLSCQALVLSLTFLILLGDTLANGLVVFRLFLLWNRSRRVMYALALAFIVYEATVMACSIIIGLEAKSRMVYISVSNISLCDILLVHNKFYVIVWVCAIVFDVFSAALLFLNALHRPRGVDDNLVKILYQDGILFFAGTLSLRLLSFLLAFVGPESYDLLGLFLVVPLIQMLVARTLLRLFVLEEKAEALRMTANTIGLQVHHVWDDPYIITFRKSEEYR